jgi:cyclic pyranopterin phosphate synthase
MSALTAEFDQWSRPFGVLRISLTARCNLACPYCCPDPKDPPGLLDLDQHLRLIRVACGLGLQTLRLTGGEPLLSDRLLPLLEALAAGRADAADPLARLRDVALTTNGVLLTPEKALALRAAGLDRITVSLDALEGEVVAKMAGLRGGQGAGDRLVEQVLGGLTAARSAGFDPASGGLKLNAVMRRGLNDCQLLPLAKLARDRGVELRLIEYMDVGNRNGWTPDQVISAEEMIQRIDAHWPLQSISRQSGATARRWRYVDGRGCIGVIASITEPFCGDCNRLRVTADGQAYTCLFAPEGTDLRPFLQSEEALKAVLCGLWRQRRDRYSEERHWTTESARHAEMAYLGG